MYTRATRRLWSISLERPHAGHTLDLVFTSTALRAGSFIVHQGDECCSQSPLCNPALGSDHFLYDFPFHVGDVQELHRVPLVRRNFPVVLDCESPFCSVPERNLMIGRLLCKSCQFLALDSHSAVALSVRCLITWWQFCGTLPSHFTRHFPTSLATDASQGGGRTLAIMHWLLATQRGETFEGLFFRKTTLSSPPVGFTFTVWFAQPVADSGDLGKTASSACACRTPGLARVVSTDASGCQTVAAHTMPYCGGVHRLSALREHVTTGGHTSRLSPRLEDATTSPRTSLAIFGWFFGLAVRQAPSTPLFQNSPKL